MRDTTVPQIESPPPVPPVDPSDRRLSPPPKPEHRLSGPDPLEERSRPPFPAGPETEPEC